MKQKAYAIGDSNPAPEHSQNAQIAERAWEAPMLSPYTNSVGITLQNLTHVMMAM